MPGGATPPDLPSGEAQQAAVDYLPGIQEREQPAGWTIDSDVSRPAGVVRRIGQAASAREGELNNLAA